MMRDDRPRAELDGHEHLAGVRVLQQRLQVLRSIDIKPLMMRS